MRTIFEQNSECDSSLRAVGGGGLHCLKTGVIGQQFELRSAQCGCGDLQQAVQDPLVPTS